MSSTPTRLHRTMQRLRPIAGRVLAMGAVLVLLVTAVALAAETVPTDVKMPGTQPIGTDNPPTINPYQNCGCHDFTPDALSPPESVPVFGWSGAPMANAGRDPLFWATVAVAEQDFDGVGDLCIKCHSVGGWLEGRSTPTNASGLDPGTDAEGIMCEFCHLIVNPDQANTIPNPPEGTYSEEQNGTFVAYDESTGEGYYGGAEYVLNGGGTRLGPYVDHGARHDAIPSAYHRDARLCGTCHDVSNPAVGDLAANHGSIAPFTGPFSGVPGGPVEDKVAFNNPPHTYGVVERTFSEWISSGLDTTLVSSFNDLPEDLKAVGGGLEFAYQASLWGNCGGTPEGDFCKVDAHCGGGETCVIPANNTDYEDGTPRYYTCQTCHMGPTGGEAANQGRPSPHKGEIRGDLPRHDQTGGGYWIQDAMVYQDDAGTLVFGSGITSDVRTAMDAAQLRAGDTLRQSGTLSATQVGNQVEVKVTNVTGHKLISGYPEGRRMWLHLEWKDGDENTIHEDGEWGPLSDGGGTPVTVSDNGGTPWVVQTILDPSSTKVYEAKPGMSQDWAAALISLGWPADLPLEYDRLTHAPTYNLQNLADEAPGTYHPTFHFVLNNVMYKDNRIPPWGMDYDLALERNCPPIPPSQYGDPGSGGTYDHFDVVTFDVPSGAESVEVHLLYQSTSWEYIQFLWQRGLVNDDDFLGNEGVNLLDAWLNTEMSEPYEMTEITIPVTGVAFNAPGHASENPAPLMEVTAYDAGTGDISLTYSPACDATGHTVHYGLLENVSTYEWTGADCSFDTSGSAVMPTGDQDLYWVIVGRNPSFEGSYSAASSGERPPNTTAAGACFRTQNLATVCE